MEDPAPLKVPLYEDSSKLFAMVCAMIFVIATLSGVMRFRTELGIGSPFMRPHTTSAAKQLVRDTFSDVGEVDEPTVTSERTVSVVAKIGLEQCVVQLYAPTELSNGYGWVISHVNCPSRKG